MCCLTDGRSKPPDNHNRTSAVLAGKAQFVVRPSMHRALNGHPGIAP
jgi:hypothetical protein